MDFRVNGQVVYTPHPKQLVFHECAARYPLFGGARGPGKSHALRWHGHMSCMTVPHMQVLLLRRALTDLRRSHGRYMPIEAGQLGATWKPNQNGAGEMHYPNGSIMELGHCQHEDDYAIYLSAQYDLVLFDELVTFSEYQYLMVRSSCRTTKPGLVARAMGATNPGISPVNSQVAGLGEAWIKRRWIDKDVTLEEDLKYREEDYAYIPALMDDNPYLQKDDYDQILGSLPPELRRAYREGSWDIFVGQFFPEFDKQKHVQDLNVHVSRPRMLGLDWGYADEGVCLWGVFTQDGQLYIEDEYVFNGRRRNKQTAPEVASVIAARNRDRGLHRIQGVYADPHMFANEGHVGETHAESFARCGVPLIEANNDREHGWGKLRQWLRPMPGDPQGRPWMIVSPKCEYLIRTVPQLVMSETRPEDCETRGADHGADAWRYLIAGRPAPHVERLVEPVYEHGTMGWMKQQILSRAGRRREGRLGAGQVRKRTYAY